MSRLHRDGPSFRALNELCMEDKINFNSTLTLNTNGPEQNIKNGKVPTSSFGPIAPGSLIVNSIENSTSKSDPTECGKPKEHALNTPAQNTEPWKKKKMSNARKRRIRKIKTLNVFQRDPWRAVETLPQDTSTSPWDFGDSPLFEYFNAKDSEGNYLWENAFMSVLNQNPFAGDRGSSSDGLQIRDNPMEDLFGVPGPSGQQEVPFRSFESSQEIFIQNQLPFQTDDESVWQKTQNFPSGDSFEYPFKWALNQSGLLDQQTNSNQYDQSNRFEEERSGGQPSSSSRDPRIYSRRELPDREEWRRKRSLTPPRLDRPPKQRRTQTSQNRSYPSKPTTDNRPPRKVGPPPKKPPPHDKTQPPLSIKMAVVNAEHPIDRLSEREIQRLQMTLLEAIKQNPGKGPRFNSCAMKDGGLVVDCADDKAVGWLQKTISAMNPWFGITLKIVGAKKLGQVTFGKLRMRIPITFDYMTNGQILDMIEKQNSNIRAKDWAMLERKSERGDLVLLVKIPQAEVETLRKMSFMVYFGFDRVKLSLLQK